MKGLPVCLCPGVCTLCAGLPWAEGAKEINDAVRELTPACAGYCSLVHFSEGELGTPTAANKIPEPIQPLTKSASKSVAPMMPVTPEAMPAQPAASGAQNGSAAMKQKHLTPTAIARTASMPELAVAPATGQPAES